jgi:hypothetical protein
VGNSVHFKNNSINEVLLESSRSKAHQETGVFLPSGVKSKRKVIPVTGRGGLYRCGMLMIPHCLDSRLTDGGKVVSSTHRPRSTP